MALSENPSLKEVIDEAERLNSLIVGRGGAQTITPKTSNQTLNKGYYKGNITIKGDSNLIASNIVSGKSIFGISGNVTAVKKVTASDTVIMSMPFTGTTTGVTSWTPYSIPIYLTGAVRVQATCYNGAGNTAYKTTLQFHLYRNGELIQSSGTVEGTSTNHQTLSYDFTVKCGDIINIQTTGKSNTAMYIYNVYVKGSVS